MKLPPDACRGHNESCNRLAELGSRLGPIEYRSVGQVQNYGGNPRRHPEKQLVRLTASVRRFGVALPVLVDEHNVIIAGEAVTEAARRLGHTEIPVIVARGWSRAQIRAFRLAANRLAELATWDEELLAIELESVIEIAEVPIELLGWETAVIDILLDPAATVAAKGADDPADEQVASPASPTTRAGDIWHLGEHRLLCGSSLETSAWDDLLDGRQATMVFSDAPYNVPVNGHVRGKGKVKHAEFAMASGEMNREEFTAFLVDSIGPMAAATRDGGLLYLCMDYRHLREILAAIDRCGLDLINLCVWNKTNGGQGALYRSKHELVLVAKRGKAPHINNVELGRHGRYRTNVWDYAGVNTFGATRMQDLADHPTVKPVALVADAIRDVTKPGDIVIDGFMGSGTTMLAAERTKRVACGIEIEPAYVDVAVRRWEKLTGEEAVFAKTGETFAEVTAARAAEVMETQ